MKRIISIIWHSTYILRLKLNNNQWINITLSSIEQFGLNATNHCVNYI